MTIYNFNLLVGYESTGVDYAQAYRARILRAACRQKYIFTEVPNYRELEYYTRIGIAEEEILILPLWFSHAENLFPILSFDEVSESIVPDGTGYELLTKDRVRILQNSERHEAFIFHMTGKGSVHTVEYYINSTLIRKDHFSDRLLYSEYYTVEKDKLTLFANVREVEYFDEDGVPALREYRVQNRRIYVFPDHQRCSPQQLLERFMRENTFRSDDLLLLDRVGEHFQVVLRNKGEAKLAFFMHSKLTFEDYSDSHHWRGVNYEYVDLVRNVGQLDAILTSTEEQAEELADWFLENRKVRVRTYALPVGGIAKLTLPNGQRKRHSLVTVSRLDHRKRIDLLIRAAAKARESVPDLTLDIYGRGPARDAYIKLIDELGVGEYVRLMGYVNNFNRYAAYEGYISASLWETFGLTLLEAMSGGLPLIGLDVPYGNRCFIRDGENGYLIPFESGEEDDVTVNHLTEAVRKLFTEANLEAYSTNSYNGAAAYTMTEIRGRWIDFLNDIGVYDSDRISR